MFTSSVPILALTLLIGAGASAGTTSFGEPASEAEIKQVFWAVFPDGEFLPEGSGNAARGEQVYTQQCMACHGVGGKDGISDRLVKHSPEAIAANLRKKKTIGSYWPYASGVFNYIRRSMPMTAPKSLSNNDYYALTAYLLHINELIKKNTEMDKHSLPKVIMPNRDNFIDASKAIPEKYRY